MSRRQFPPIPSSVLKDAKGPESTGTVKQDSEVDLDKCHKPLQKPALPKERLKEERRSRRRKGIKSLKVGTTIDPSSAKLFPEDPDAFKNECSEARPFDTLGVPPGLHQLALHFLTTGREADGITSGTSTCMGKDNITDRKTIPCHLEFIDLFPDVGSIAY
ncbi:hypothetical protein NDU88_000633 [Pleurodeles waltl]|uniref:Uncharacterized protein n=1 Tax=Pleurodeles waltl TaxID=8319 RepID=A0AAV7UQK5_PLEWA|nr:hypothetical protein NDU88_000633 [Pleurodeles waltl]